ncbi:MAG: glycosyltransferase family 2 protein, partial [Planctomycetaceae bacterium]|nr:glycosyltransferase family 2 protein [Planctomycetaceae bacterium]
LATGLKLTDLETCYKIFRSDVIKSIPLKSNRFEIEAEITVKIAKRNLRICEIPINYNGRDYKAGKKITWKDGIIAIWTILKYKFFDHE